MTPRRRLFVLMLAGGLVLLPACGDAFVSPAAVVNGFRITQTALNARAQQVLTSPSLASQLSGPGGEQRRRYFTRQVLGFLIRQYFVEQYAKSHGISVTDAEIDQAIAEAVRQSGGQDAFDRQVRDLGLTLADVRRNIRESSLGDKVRNAVARQRLPGTAAPTPVQIDQAFGNWLREEMARGDIQVNPRFGGFDPRQGTVCLIVSTAGDLSCEAP